MNIGQSIFSLPRLVPEAIALIKHFEGCFLEAYRDPLNIWTIGYGHIADVARGMSITPHRAESLLMEDLETAQTDVRRNVKVPLNENEFGALVSLAFNIGGSAFGQSTLVRKLNRGDRHGAAKEIERFVHGHVGGRRVTLRGLELRRKAEMELFQAPVGTLVRDGKMILADRIIPVEHPSYNLVQLNPSPPHQQQLHPVQVTNAVAEIPAETKEPEPTVEPRIPHTTLVSIGAGAALGVIPATNTPAAHSLAGAVGQIWEQAGGPAVFPPLTAWLRWADAIQTGIANLFKTGNFTPLFDFATDFIHSHEAMVGFIATVLLVLIRTGLGGLLVERRR